ncbi:MAG TPA: choice-of-anchor Q domain-containing protein [bacterium]|nr:choice-of-anchor Q domain-containing protein [bacterium]
MLRKSTFSTCVGIFGLLVSAASQSAVITPNITTDPPLPGVNTGTDCSLRMAMQSINNGGTDFEGGCGGVAVGALGDNDEIVLGADTYVLTIADGGNDNADGDLVAFNDFILTGQGVDTTIIDASGIPGGDRIIEIQDITSASISGVTFTGGSSSDGAGAILSLASLLQMDDVRLTDNEAPNSGGGALIIGGGDALISNSTIDGNRAEACGGLIASPGNAGISNSTISGNQALTDEGGGICSAGFLFLTNSTVSGNTAAEDGGGIIVATFGSSNGLKGAYNVTIAFNQAGGSGGGIAGVVASNGQGDPFPVTVFNTIIARNTAGNTGNDCANGDFPSGGFNLIGEIGPNDNCTDFVDGTNGDQVGAPGSPIDPLLGPLADNGGPTQTHALLVGSPAIDRGNPDGCEALNAPLFFADDTIEFNELTIDQRGETRPVAILDPALAICDIGAFEFQVPVPTPTPSPTPTPTPPPFQGFVEGSGCSLAHSGASMIQGAGAWPILALFSTWAFRRLRRRAK